MAVVEALPLSTLPIGGQRTTGFGTADGAAPKGSRLGRAAMLLTLAAAAMVLGALAFPLWSVNLTAPQYPEGLGMKILAHTVRGATSTDLDNINHLNRYIGMKAIEPGTIPELRIMPWIIIALSVTGMAVAAFRRRAALYAWVGMFGAVCIAGLIDFWKWEHDYGHNLDPRAVLKIPGMSYQPPLIGARQLLNFRAVSIPDVGGVLLMLAFVIAAAAAVIAWRQARQAQKTD